MHIVRGRSMKGYMCYDSSISKLQCCRLNTEDEGESDCRFRRPLLWDSLEASCV